MVSMTALGRRAGKWIAAERRGVRHRATLYEGEALGRLLRRSHGADRYFRRQEPWPASSRRASPRRADVPNHRPVRPIPVCTSSKIRIVPVSVAQLPQTGQIAGRRDHDAALGLNRLDDESARLPLLEHHRCGSEVTEWHEIHRLEQGTETEPVLLLAGNGNRCERPAVKRTRASRRSGCAWVH